MATSQSSVAQSASSPARWSSAASSGSRGAGQPASSARRTAGGGEEDFGAGLVEQRLVVPGGQRVRGLPAP
ncbi:hypothetical protein ACWEP3_30045, partial [Streptomyces albidoflavus]